MSRERHYKDRPLEEALSRLDLGHIRREGDMLYLAQEQGTVMGEVKFTIEGTLITGPDGTQFDLNNMRHGGEDGIYTYPKRMTGTDTVTPWKTKGQA